MASLIQFCCPCGTAFCVYLNEWPSLLFCPICRGQLVIDTRGGAFPRPRSAADEFCGSYATSYFLPAEPSPAAPSAPLPDPSIKPMRTERPKKE